MRVTRVWYFTAYLFVALGAFVLVVVRAWDTGVGMNHATGTVAALADAALHGEAAGHEGASDYLGALYAPPFPLIVAGLKQAGLSWLHALRLASLLSALLYLGACAWAAHAAGAGRGGVALTVALLAACNLFKVGSLAGRADLFAAALSVLAIGAWLRDRARWGWACAVFAAVAWLCKVSEVTVPAAIVANAAFTREPAPAVRFVLRFALACAVGVLVMLPFHPLEWYAQAFSTTLFAPPNLSHVLRGPAEMLRYVASFAELGLVAVLAIAALLEPAMRRSPLRWATGAALLVALAVLANRGADHNHLLTTIALAGVCAGAAWEASPARTLSLVAVVLLLPAACWRDEAAERRYAASPAERRAQVIAAVRAEPGPVLAEDPLVLLAAGRRSPITDPSTVRSRALKGDPRAQRIAARTAASDWALVVLELDPEKADVWYRDFHFGDAVLRPLLANYARAGAADDFVLYRRRSEPAASP